MQRSPPNELFERVSIYLKGRILSYYVNTGFTRGIIINGSSRVLLIITRTWGVRFQVSWGRIV